MAHKIVGFYSQNKSHIHAQFKNDDHIKKDDHKIPFGERMGQT
jgi:hypothetical protein